jgi:GR25 family glycosyltransferase involved in LPS biosynthesis
MPGTGADASPAPPEIQAAYVINMDSARERLRAVRDQARAEGIEFRRVPGVDVRDPEVMRRYAGDVHPMCGRWCSPGALGCALSHLETWRRCARADWECALVVEDDVVLAPGFVDEAARALRRCPADFDILLLGHSRADVTATGGLLGLARGGVRRVNDAIVVPPMFYGAHCYLVSRKGARLLARDWKVGFQVDIQLATDPRLALYATSTPLAHQRGNPDSSVSPFTGTFPKTLGHAANVMEPAPGLNLYGLSVPHPALWAVLLGVMGWTRSAPWVVAALFAVEAALGVTAWWALALAAWLAGYGLRGATAR